MKLKETIVFLDPADVKYKSICRASTTSAISDLEALAIDRFGASMWQVASVAPCHTSRAVV